LLSEESDNNITIHNTQVPLKCTNSYPMSFHIEN